MSEINPNNRKAFEVLPDHHDSIVVHRHDIITRVRDLLEIPPSVSDDTVRANLSSYVETIRSCDDTEEIPPEIALSLSSNLMFRQLGMMAQRTGHWDNIIHPSILLSIYYDELSEEPPKRMTYGVLYPSYVRMIRSVQGSPRLNPDPLHVLIGADNLHSVHEFVATVRNVSPTSRVLAIDPNLTPLMGRWAPFVWGADGTHLPFSSEAVHVFHTNCLLDKLDVSCSQNNREKIVELIHEISRVLVPGGALLLVERSVSQEHGYFILNQMMRAGLEPTEPRPAMLLRSRQSVRKIFCGNAGTISPSDIRQVNSLSAVLVRKRI